MKDSRLEQVLEFYRPRPIKTSKKMLYPRNFTLSPEFIDSFHYEYDRMVHEGHDPKKLVEKFSKALRFHTNDDRSQAVTEAKKQWEKKQERPEEVKKGRKEKATLAKGEVPKDEGPGNGVTEDGKDKLEEDAVDDVMKTQKISRKAAERSLKQQGLGRGEIDRQRRERAGIKYD